MIAADILRLNERARTALMAHFLALPAMDRNLRFGTPLGRAGIAGYVDGIDLARDAVFGIGDGQTALVGVAHLALADGAAELGLSVLPAHRGFGLGAALFERAAAHARTRRVPRLFMRWLAGNAPIMRIARRFGMEIGWNDGYADAQLRLWPASLVAASGDWVRTTLAACDRVLEPRLPAKG
jgi:GNAT superfamily N-acetyltransferase